MSDVLNIDSAIRITAGIFQLILNELDAANVELKRRSAENGNTGGNGGFRDCGICSDDSVGGDIDG